MYRSIVTGTRTTRSKLQQYIQKRNVSNKVDMTYQRAVAIPERASGSGRFQQSIYNNIFARSPIYYAFWFAVAGMELIYNAVHVLQYCDNILTMLYIIIFIL